MTLAPGHVVHGRYRIIRSLGRGGMASTYEVHDLLSDRTLALKLVRAGSDDLLSALRTEFAILRELAHPSLIAVHDFGRLSPRSRSKPICFYTADLIRGDPFDSFASGRRWRAIRTQVLEVLSALQCLHRSGIRHGDPTPANIIVREDGRAVLIDLGCASALHAPSAASISGTRGVLAPELLRGDAADERADLFSFGVTLERVVATLTGTIPAEVHRLIEGLTGEEPSARPSSVAAVLEALGARSSSAGARFWASRRLVGRDRDLLAATDAIEAVVEGRRGPRVLFVTGPSGVGRTRFLREVAWVAQQRALAVDVDASVRTPVTALLSCVFPGEAPSDVAALLAKPGPWFEAERAPVVLLLDDAHRLPEAQSGLLQTFARSLTTDAPVLLVISSEGARMDLGVAAQSVALKPLDRCQLRAWIGGALSERAVRALERASGGMPGAVRAVLAPWSEAAQAEHALATRQSEAPVAERVLASVAGLPPAGKEALALLATADGAIRFAWVRAHGMTDEVLNELAREGIAERAIAGWRLVRAADAPALLRGLGKEAERSAHERWVGLLDLELAGDSPSESEAQRVVHLARAGRVEEARAALLAGESAYAAAPPTWMRAAAAVVDEGGGGEAQRALVRLGREAGFVAESYARARRWLGEASTLDDASALELATCAIRAGDMGEAEQVLTALLGSSDDDAMLLRGEQLMAHMLLKQGRYRDALGHAQRASERAGTPEERVDAQETEGLALSFLGELDGASKRMQEAAALLAEVADPRRRSRVCSSKAMVAYHRGHLAEAEVDYGEALRLAQQSGLVDQVATAALNLGTVCHQRGHWGQALEAYAHAERTARGLGQRGTEAWVQFDLAKLYADLGAFDRAEAAVAACVAMAERAGVAALRVACDTVRGEVALARGDVDVATSLFSGALEAFERDQSVREQAEVLLHLAETAMVRGAWGEALRRIEGASGLAERANADDVRTRAGLVRGRYLVGTQRGREAVDVLEPLVGVLGGAGQREWEAEAHALLAKAWEAQGSSLLAAQHVSRARLAWERAATALPVAMRDAFRAHPRRAEVMQLVARGGEAPSDDVRLRRIFDLAKWINSSVDMQQVLERAMDAAIELTGAERGFVLMARDSAKGKGALRPAVARNVDREQLGRSHMKFSRSIAERVLAEGDAVMTDDAGADERFRGGKSVHAMSLRSVLCVPVRSSEGVLGALYVDNRFQRGRFTERDTAWLGAFADFVAIALTNAGLQAQLEERNRQLEAERERVGELLRGQAEQIDRLSEQVRRAQGVREQRYPYVGIVGESPAMKRVFELLDRVIDTMLPVLVEGDSGTGKELVARAIHQYGPRASGPLVAINCGAVPDTLLESELFGVERGAFTGADRARDGLVVRAHGGTLFLDEIGEMSPATQVKLLRVLQEREVRPIGAREAKAVDFRLVCATNRRLREEVSRGRFREDLYYRIAAVEVRMPSVRERSEDLRALTAHVLEQIGEQTGRPVPLLTGQAMRKVLAYDWPGNVRQLENALTRAAVVADAGRIRAADLELGEMPSSAARKTRASYLQEEGQRIAEALEASRWNVARTARLLGIPRATVYRRMKQYGLMDEGKR